MPGKFVPSATKFTPWASPQQPKPVSLPQLAYGQGKAGTLPFYYLPAGASEQQEIEYNPPKVDGTLRLVCLGCTHGWHRSVEVPEGDVLVFLGDISGFPRNPDGLLCGGEAAEDFASWLEGLRFPDGKLVLPGNHDLCIEADTERFRGLFEKHGAQLMVERAVEVRGIRFYASPISTDRGNQSNAFQALTLGSDLTRKDPPVHDTSVVAQFPGGVDVLLTHGPPLGYGDARERDPPGSAALYEYIASSKPALHIFADFHGNRDPPHGHGAHPTPFGTTCVNVSMGSSVGPGRKVVKRGAFIIDVPLREGAG